MPSCKTTSYSVCCFQRGRAKAQSDALGVLRWQTLAELAMEGPRSKRTSAGVGAGAGCLDAVDIVSSSSDSEDLEGSSGSSGLQFLTVKTVQVYITAIAKIYHTQVSLRLNTHTNFRGTALKSLIKDLARTQAQKR